MSSQSIFVNALTFLRVPLTFLWLIFAIVQHYRGGFLFGSIALTLFFFAGLTDAFDGALARKWNVVSQFGKMADPLMDKVVSVVAFPTLVWLVAISRTDNLHACVLLVFTILFILRDLWVTFMRAIGSMFGANVAAMRLGKIRTALAFPTAGFIYLHIWLSSLLPVEIVSVSRVCCFALEVFMIVLNLVSFVSYTRTYSPYLKKALEHH